MTTASCGWAGHIARVRPSIHAPVPIALANREAFKVFTETAPAEHVLPSIQDTLSEVSVFRGKCPSVGEKSPLRSKRLNERYGDFSPIGESSQGCVKQLAEGQVCDV
jgi:hypothetical protein